MRVLTGIAIAIFGLVLAYAVWLVATPDEDGGRQGFGTILLVGLSVAAVLVTVLTVWSARSDKGRR